MKLYTIAFLALALPFIAVTQRGCPDGVETKTIVVTKYICPTMRTYSQAKQDRIIAQLELIEEVAPDVVGAIKDYSALRDGIRKCASEAGNTK